MRTFLLMLNRQQDSDSMTLQCLSFRLDFNEYYAKKDSRLSVPLTYHHRRLSSASNSFYNSPLNQSMTISGHGHGLATSLGNGLLINNGSPNVLSTSLPIAEMLEEY